MSFMVRCTIEANGCFRVLTRQIQSGEERHFTSLEDAAGYMQEQLQAEQGINSRGRRDQHGD